MTDRNKSNEKYLWPDKLMIRDTTLHDDLGGLGQRIYTTAGAGYEKREYVRGDIVKELARLLRYAAEHSSLAPHMNDAWRSDALAALDVAK